MMCDVVVIGGGISGMYMAETLMRIKKEHNACLFEKDSRFGGRDFDVRFSRAPNISISKNNEREKMPIIIQWNPVYTDTKGTCQNVRIIGVSVLSGLFF